MIENRSLTPSLVQVHVMHGEMCSVAPISIVLVPTAQDALSRHKVKSIFGIALQGTRGFLKK